jgi:hypothetical protein
MFLSAFHAEPRSQAPSPDADLTGEACRVCQRTGGVWVTSFRWDGDRHLRWHCQACRHAWMTSERRRQDRPER